MDLAGEYTFDAPRAIVWEALRDPDVLGSVLPGGGGISEVGENEYEGDLKIKVGPVQGKFKGKIKLSDIVPPESYSLAVDGKGAPGFVKATGSLKLSENEDGTTQCEYAGNARIGGRIASVGQRLLDASAKSITRQSLDALNEYVKVQVAQQEIVEAAEEAGVPEEEIQEAVAAVKVPEYQAPSQTELAVNVAKDVAGDLIPAQYRPVLIAGAVIVIALALWWILT